MCTITLTLQYRINTPKYRFTVESDKNEITIDELTELLGNKVVKKYANYCNKSVDSREMKRYKYGQMKIIRGYLEANYG